VDLDITMNAAREAANRRMATCLAIGGNLVVSVPLWLTPGNLALEVAAHDRWVVGTVTALLITLLAGATLQRSTSTTPH
jgi:hypothetical protein